MNIELLKKTIKEKNLSVAELEKILGFGNGTIGKWERNSPSIDNVKKVVDYLGISIECLIRDSDDSRPPEELRDEELPDIRLVGRAANKMNTVEHGMLIEVAKIMFPNAFVGLEKNKNGDDD